MKIEDLKAKLKEIINKQKNNSYRGDEEVQGHKDAEDALLDYINSNEVKKLFFKVDRWYE